MYSYNRLNFTIPKIDHNDSFVYIGNLTIIDPNQYQVNVLCVKSLTHEYLSSKIYFFGHPPSTVLTGSSKVELKCRDFNIMRVVCCMSLSETEIGAKTGFADEHNGNLIISLINIDSGFEEPKLNQSCFNMKQTAFTLSLHLKLLIRNELGNMSDEFLVNRTDIFKPERPVVSLKPINNSIFQIIITMIDEGEFVIVGTCSSSSPVAIVQNISYVITKRITKKTVKHHWKPNSNVDCNIRSQILFGISGAGQLSDESTSSILMPEGIPSCGPMISPAFMTYSTYNADYLENIVVYFVDVPLIDRNGVIVEYEWRCENCIYGNKDLSEKNQRISGNVRSIKLDRAAFGSSLSMAACTRVGCNSFDENKFHFGTLTEHVPSHRIYLIRDSKFRNNVTVLWYLNGSRQNSGILICHQSHTTMSTDDDDCSMIKLVELGGEMTGRKQIAEENMLLKKFAFIPSLSGTNLSKIKWNDCINENSPIYEIEKKLINQSERFITHRDRCHWLKCQLEFIIRIPSCKDFPIAIFNGIVITYQAGNVVKNLSYFCRGNYEISAYLNDLESSTSYEVKISMINHNDEEIVWYKKLITVGWWSPTKLGTIIFGIIVSISLIIGIICCILRQGQKAHFTKKYFQPTYNNVCETRNKIKPLNINNEIVDNQMLQEYKDKFTPTNSPIISVKTNDSGMIYQSTKNSDLSNSSSSQESEVPNSDTSYILRPDERPPQIPMQPKYFCLVESAEKVKKSELPV